MGLEMREMLNTMPQIGRVEWIGLRPGKGDPIVEVATVKATLQDGLIGDRFNGAAGAKRQVTLIQKEHIETVGSILGLGTVLPNQLRRNIVVSGINLQALKDKQFQIGDAILYGTGNCPPCSQMEEALGPGGYNAMRGHGGITARVIQEGTISENCEVKLLKDDSLVAE